MSAKFSEEKTRGEKDRRRHSRDGMNVSQHASEIVDRVYDWERPSDSELQQRDFSGGDETRKAIRALFDQTENRFDVPEVARLVEVFNKGIDIWARAGLFSKEREAAGYVRPDFKRDYLRLFTQEILEMTRPGEKREFNKGYRTPIFTPMDVPLHDHKDAEKLTYFKLLKEVLLRAFYSTVEGKSAETLLLGAKKVVLGKDSVDLNNILYFDDDFVDYIAVEDRKPVDGPRPDVLSFTGTGLFGEREILAKLDGVEKRTGGIMRLERDQLIVPQHLDEKEMNCVDLANKLDSLALPSGVFVQNLKQAIAYTIYNLEALGVVPEYAAYAIPGSSELLPAEAGINLANDSYIVSVGIQNGHSPGLWWDLRKKQFFVSGGAGSLSYKSVRLGMRLGLILS